MPDSGQGDGSSATAASRAAPPGSLLRFPPEYGAVLNGVVEQAAAMLKAPCVLWLLSDDGAWLRLAASAGPGPEVARAEVISGAPARGEPAAPLPQRPPDLRLPAGEGLPAQVLSSAQPLFLPKVPADDIGMLTDPARGLFPGLSGLRSLLLVPLPGRARPLGLLGAARAAPARPFTERHRRCMEKFAGQAAQAISVARLYEDNLRRLESLTALYASAAKLSHNLDLERLVRDVTRTCVDVFGAALAWVGRAEPDGSVSILAHHPARSRYPLLLTVRWDETPEGQGPTGRAIRRGFPEVVADIEDLPSEGPIRRRLEAEGFRCAGAFPLLSRGSAFGSLALYSREPGFFTPERVELFQAYAHQAAAALENARLLLETERRLEQISTLHAVQTAISSSLDLRAILTVVVDQVITHLRVDAAGILLLNPYTQALEFAAGQGFRTRALQHTVLRLGQGYAGRAATERRAIVVPNLGEAPQEFVRSPLLPQEDFTGYVAVPLIAKGRVQGVLEVFTRAALPSEPEWMEFLSSLAGQAAIAIDNASLFEELQRANASLIEAYDATLEGWVRALDLRNQETEGHTQRVTTLTLRLARAMGVREEDLLHIRRGALLHDIGKMAISDTILLKPGPLTAEEWAIMHQHPNYARDLLWPIPYLRPALDIPSCHHERWDGSGYPQRLRGEEIPLAARIFAVADVWDALTSDRPYRRAWSREEAVAYLRREAGRLFDPQVVEAFVRLLEEDAVGDSAARGGGEGRRSDAGVTRF
ncbi:MAG: GAF domain-containing protein [Armatimonadota bacterium]|nr:GAF domain-containing protein [Armatimonadota bacterium]